MTQNTRAHNLLRELEGIVQLYDLLGTVDPPPQWEHVEFVRAALGDECIDDDGRVRELERVRGGVAVLRWILREG